MLDRMPYTHRVAVIGYLIEQDAILLLKRRKPPHIWAPPGGHLLPDEEPRTGLIREFREETGLDIEVLAPVDVWFGTLEELALLSIDFLVRRIGGHLHLSREHEAARWFSRSELPSLFPEVPEGSPQFTTRDFEKAFRIKSLLFPD